ncbi:glycosyltransferase family 2 protein [Psychroserpens mesophilus]|uniref:glycosyltransferase family 2 protein n=1 Tax=Psychroserpens mesophilus TaxID=325473 RepID=UPI003D64AF9E
MSNMLSILVTHYNRPEALAICISAIQSLKFPLPVELVVSDDCSTPDNLKQLQKLPINTLVTAPVNQGLASNLNKGIKACQGDYILYVQEDFIIRPEFLNLLPESIELLNSGALDMIRFRANYVFNHLIPITTHIFEIPKFSFKNFNINTFQYSDNPFLTTPAFFEKHNYYLENTSGPYGETEFAIRVLKSTSKIGIADRNYFDANNDSSSVMVTKPVKQKLGLKRKFWRFARALRQHLEWILYQPNNRKLCTYKNTYKNKRKS